MLVNILNKIDAIEHNMDQSVFRCSNSHRNTIAQIGHTIDEMESSGYNILSSNKSINDSKNKTKSSSLLSARPNLPIARKVDDDLQAYVNSGMKKGTKEGNMTFNNNKNNTLEFSLGSTPNAKL